MQVPQQQLSPMQLFIGVTSMTKEQTFSKDDEKQKTKFNLPRELFL